MVLMKNDTLQTIVANSFFPRKQSQLNMGNEERYHETTRQYR